MYHTEQLHNFIYLEITIAARAKQRHILYLWNHLGSTGLAINKCQDLFDTVVFKSLRMSRVTGPKIFENFRTCHGSPRGSSKVQNQSRNRQKKRLQKTHFSCARCVQACFRVRARGLSRNSNFIELMLPFASVHHTVVHWRRARQFVAVEVSEHKGKWVFQLYRLLARSSYLITVGGAFLAISEGLRAVPPISNRFSNFFWMSQPSHLIFETQSSNLAVTGHSPGEVI
jgi:hypothetical protein